MIAHLKLQNAKLRREQYGTSAERTERLLAQFELELEDLEADAAGDELAAQAAAAKTTAISAFERKKPVRKPFPAHLPRERVVVAAPCSCPACGGNRLSRLGEDVTETLEVIPRSWKVAAPPAKRLRPAKMPHGESPDVPRPTNPDAVAHHSTPSLAS